MPRILKKAKQRPKRSLRGFTLGEGFTSVPMMMTEIADMMDVLMGRDDPPIDAGVMTLHEVADAFYARAAEMTMAIQRAEREGRVLRNSPAYKFRTGELRTFMDVAKSAAALGSRRITNAQLEFEKSRTGRESAGWR